MGAHLHNYEQHPTWTTHLACLTCGFAIVKSDRLIKKKFVSPLTEFKRHHMYHVRSELGVHAIYAGAQHVANFRIQEEAEHFCNSANASVGICGVLKKIQEKLPRTGENFSLHYIIEKALLEYGAL
jgi:hypothetical protein